MKSCWNLKLSRGVTFVSLLVSTVTFSQYSAPEVEANTKTAEEEQYLFPIEPGTPNLLAGTMGELRSNHFHSGIDVRTGSRIGVPVLAAQKGYISRVSISTGGYGNALYVTHPNGQTTVYGHLNHFAPKVAVYVRQQQYKKKSFDINLFFKPGTFDVSRGDTIAFSGNSGGSSGPHLHFDIRSVENEALNPLEFKFGEVVDTTPPQAQKIALRTMDANSRINDQFGRFEFYVVKEGDNFKLPHPILATGTIGMEVLGYDKLDNSRSQCGINFIEATANDKRVFRQIIDKVNFGETRNILALMDYKTMKDNGDRFNKLFIDDGNSLGYYNGTVNRGLVKVDDEDIPIKIALRDTYGNQSLVNFSLRPSTLSKSAAGLRPMTNNIESEVFENTLIIHAKKELGDTLEVFSKKGALLIENAYSGSNKNTFLLDLRTSLPDSVKVGEEIYRYHFKDIIPSTVSYTYYSEEMDIKFNHRVLYDTLYLTTRYSDLDKEVFSIADNTVPLQRSAVITLKPKKSYPEKSSVYRSVGKYHAYEGGTWENGRITFSTRDLGDFVILEDHNAPSITRIAANGGSARFKIRDDLSGISYYEASINGEWLLMNYDYKTNMIWADRLDSAKPLKGELVIKVVDNAGNENVYHQMIP